MMFKTPFVCATVLALSACGGSQYASENARGYAAPSAASVAVPFARGPIQKACINSDRKARSSSRCGCVQAVADRSLSTADQRRGAKFWRNPQKLQDLRQSDSSSNARFWKEWKAFGQAAERQCKGT